MAKRPVGLIAGGLILIGALIALVGFRMDNDTGQSDGAAPMASTATPASSTSVPVSGGPDTSVPNTSVSNTSAPATGVAPTTAAPYTGQPHPGGDLALPVWDTAWDAPFYATPAELEVYLDHLATTGYSGAWMSLIGFSGRRNGQLTSSPALGVPQAIVNDGAMFVSDEALSRMLFILDAAQRRGLQIGVVATWGQHWLNGDGDNCFANPANIGNGPLQASNAELLGRQIGAYFGDHPAIAYWILGGDNYCQGSVGDSSEDPAIWRNYAAGIRAGGSTLPMTYHTPHSPGPGLRPPHTWMMDEAWVDFLSPQTGHCVPASMAIDNLTALAAVTPKPIVAAEMRYESPAGVANFCGAIASATDIADDTRAAVTAGADALVFGHHHRFSWAADIGSGSLQEPNTASVFATFGSPGELALFKTLRAGAF